MILTLNTSGPVCELDFYKQGHYDKVLWDADRGLARGLSKFIEDNLQSRGLSYDDISGLAVFQGPGSFTGLRIGITYMNTLASMLEKPIVGGQGEHWKRNSIRDLESGNNTFVVLPNYGAEAKITSPKK